jgi:hypothetical protein
VCSGFEPGTDGFRVYHLKKNEMGGSYSIYGGEEMCIQGFDEELEGNRPLERIRLHGRIILK